MRFIFIVACILLVSVDSFSQERNLAAVDSLYKEDQFYAGVTYNLIGNKVTDMSQSGFSLGFHLGFIKDMPVNKRRNVSFGIGLGYSSNSYNQNLLISKDDNTNLVYSLLDTDTFSKNKFSTHFVEMPLEFRWRTSTTETYSFWRIYTGLKVGYMVTNTSKYRGDLGDIKYGDIDDFNKVQYGLTLSVGYNTWNLHIYYALNPIFSDNVTINGESLDVNAIKLGLMFYFL